MEASVALARQKGRNRAFFDEHWQDECAFTLYVGRKSGIDLTAHPFRFHRVLAEYHNQEIGPSDPVIDPLCDGVADLDFPLIVPNVQTRLLQANRELLDELLVLR